MTPQEDLVKQMHKKFQNEYNGVPRSLSLAEKNFRVAAMFEELEEYAASETLVDQYDALLDLLVFAIGTLDRHGFPLAEGFKTVMECNLAKEVGNNPHKSNPGRGEYKGVDLVKPAGWTGPEDKLTSILVAETAWKLDSEYQRSIATPIAMVGV